MSRHVRRSLKAAASLVFLMLIVGACSNDGFPESYEAQPQLLDDGTQVSLVERNWLEGCTVGFDQSDLAENANDVCACSYREIKTTIPFGAFVELNNGLKNDPASLSTKQATPGSSEAALIEIIKSCIANS